MSKQKILGHRGIEIVLGVVLISIIIGLDYFIVFYAMPYISSLSLSDSSMFPIVFLLQILTFLTFFGSLFFIFVVIRTFLWKSLFSISYEGFFSSIDEYRTSLKESTSDERMNAIDEYWEIIVFGIAAFFIILAIANPDNSSISDWFQIVFSVLFWASYKIGKAKQDIGLRLMSIASLVQFLFVIGTLYFGLFLFDRFSQAWLVDGTISEGYPFTSIEWAITFWFLISCLVFIMLMGKWVSYRLNRRIWNYLTQPKKKGVLIEEALYLSDCSVPNYLLYAFIILVGILGSLSQLNFVYFQNLVIACVVAILLLFSLWPLKVYIARYDLTKEDPNTRKSLFLNTGLLSSYFGGYVFSFLLGLLIVWLLPGIVFPYLEGGLQSNILYAFSVSFVFTLFLSHSLNGSLVSYLQKNYRKL